MKKTITFQNTTDNNFETFTRSGLKKETISDYIVNKISREEWIESIGDPRGLSGD